MVEKCPICEKDYISINEQNSKYNREWDNGEILRHKLNHIESPKIKRKIATLMELDEEQLKEALDFIQKYL